MSTTTTQNDIKDMMKFMQLVNNLKHMPRRGWQLSGVSNYETISGHMYAMGMMTFLLDGKHAGHVDRVKCLQLALVHDLAESIVGDIVPSDNIPESQKHAMEDEAMQRISSHLGPVMGSYLYDLYKEYEAKETPEAKLVKDFDRLDMLFSATFYEKRDETPRKLQEYFDSTEGKFHTEFGKRLVDALQEYRNSDEKLFDHDGMAIL